MLDSLETLKADLNDQRTSRRKLSSIGYRKLGCELIKGMAKIAMDEAVEIGRLCDGHTCWRQVAHAYSPPVMYARDRLSASLQQLVRAQCAYSLSIRHSMLCVAPCDALSI